MTIRLPQMIALSLVLSAPVVAHAATYSASPIPDVNWCDEFDHDLVQIPSLFSQMPQPDPGIADSYAIVKKTFSQGLQMQVETLTPEAKSCHDVRRSNILHAYALTGKAYLQFMSDDRSWELTLNQADQMLSICIASFFGKPDGAVCQKIEKTNIANKLRWKEPAI